jgi:adenylylsulfate kinase-like enzyme
MLKKYSGLWFYGNSGTGKTTASNFLKKKILSSVLVDGDQVRKHVSFDLGFSANDREIQIERVFGINKLIISSKKFPIASTVYMNKKIFNRCKKNKILVVKFVRSLKKIKNRNHIYNSKMKNVVGRDIKNLNIKNIAEFSNNKSKRELFKNLTRIFL